MTIDVARERALAIAEEVLRVPRDITTLDLKLPHVFLGPDKHQANYAWQRGRIYCWDDNYMYELCWWLPYDDPDKIAKMINELDQLVHTDGQAAFPGLRRLLQNYPFDPQWLRDEGIT